MFKLDNIYPKPGSKKSKKRVGRGTGSGHGKTACRGHKGQTSRSGGTKGAHFEGGQTPLYRRLPKNRGFKNLRFKVSYEVINLSDLNAFDGAVDQQVLVKAGLVRGKELLKVLGDGEITKALKVTASKFSESARKKIEASGGQAITC